MSVDVVVFSAVDAVGSRDILIVFLEEVEARAALVVSNVAVTGAGITIGLDDGITDVETGSVGPGRTSSWVNWAWDISAVLDLFGRAGRVGRARSAGNLSIVHTVHRNHAFNISSVAFVAERTSWITCFDAITSLYTFTYNFDVTDIKVVVLFSQNFKAALSDRDCLSTVWLPDDCGA